MMPLIAEVAQVVRFLSATFPLAWASHVQLSTIKTSLNTAEEAFSKDSKSPTFFALNRQHIRRLSQAPCTRFALTTYEGLMAATCSAADDIPFERAMDLLDNVLQPVLRSIIAQAAYTLYASVSDRSVGKDIELKWWILTVCCY